MSVLEDFRAEGAPDPTPTAPARRPRAARAPWRPLTADRLGHGLVLAWDQTIRSAGWVVVRHQPGDPGPQVLAAGTCRTHPGEQHGWATTLDDAEAVAGMVEDVTRAARADWGPLVVAHEAPPSGGGRLVRPESSALAALAVRLAARRAGLPVVMYSNQSAKLLVAASRGATKAGIAAAVAGLTWITGLDRARNEHQRDALLVALKHLEQTGVAP